MLIDSYKQESNYKRKYKLVNIDEGIDLIPFIKNRDLSYSKFEQEKDGSMSANSMSFTLTFPYSIDELFLEKMIKKNDNIVLFEDTENGLLIFDGIAEAPKIKRDRTHIYLTTEIKDKTYSLYEMKHVKEEFFQNIYLCNTSNKTNSLIHQIAYRLGFKDEELDLPDFTTIIPFVLFKKDELIIKELAYAVRLIGGVFTIENRKLVVRAEANRITETYTFDSRNILSEINIDPVYQNYEKLKITYDYYFEKDLQDMWVLVGENGNLNDANIVVRAGQDRKFSVDWLYNVDLVKNYELYEAIFTRVDGTVISFPYTLEIDETGGTLTLDNTANNYDVYVKKFKIRGIPLFMQQGNESYYPSNIDSEKLLNNLENKFVQNPNLALLYLKANYNDNCKMYRSINFTTNVNNFLEPCRKIYLNHVDFTGYIIIEKIDFQGTKMSIQAREYLEATNINDIKTIEKSSVDEYEVISNKFLTEKGLYEADLPLAPQNLLLISQALGFTITFDNFSSNLRGHFVYLKKKTDVNWMKFFINSNNYFYQTTNLVIYEVKVSSVNINGKEGETTEIKEVIPLLLNNGIIDYPEGLSPNDISSKVKSINENLEIVNSGFDSIQQEYNKIQEIVQEVDIEAISNKVKTITKEAIEIFSANEFRRTLGTRVSTIDYNKNIDELQTIDIDSDDLKEVLIEDYYSSIYQNAKQIFSVVKSTEEQQSVIQQLLNKITLLVQKDSENYSLIEQLSDGLTIAVKKDDIISTINQTAEEIQINAKRISLGHGVAVEDDKLIVVSLIGNNFMIGKGVLNKDSEIFNDGLKLYGSSPRGHLNMVANTDTGEFTLETKGHIDFKNDFNRIFLNPDTPSKSQILMNVDCFNSDGSLKSEYEGVEFQVGSKENANGYMKFDDDGLKMDVNDLSIKGQNIVKSVYSTLLLGDSSNVTHSVVREMPDGRFLTVGNVYNTPNNFITASVLNNRMEEIQKYFRMNTISGYYSQTLENLYISQTYNKALIASSLSSQSNNSRLLRVQLFDPNSTDNMQLASTVFSFTTPVTSGAAYKSEINMQCVEDVVVIAYVTDARVSTYNLRVSAYNFNGTSLVLRGSIDFNDIQLQLKSVFYFNSKYYAIILNSIYEITSTGFILYKNLITHRDVTYFNGFLYITQVYDDQDTNWVSYKIVKFNIDTGVCTDIFLTKGNYGRISSNGVDNIVVYSDWIYSPYIFLSTDGVNFERVSNNDDKTSNKSNSVGTYNVEKSAVFYGVTGGENKVIISYIYSSNAIKN